MIRDQIRLATQFHVGFILACGFSAVLADDWPKFLGPNGNSVSEEVGLTTPWPADGPKVVWSKPSGTGYAIGVVSRGNYYHFDRYQDQNRLDVLDAATGEPKWSYQYPTDYEDALGYNNGPRCCPVVDDKFVYLYGAEGELHCVSTKTKKLVWKRSLSQDFGVVSNFFGVGSTPVVFEDKLLVMVGGSPDAFKGLGPYDIGRVTGNGSGVVALDKATGETLYKISDELASYASMTFAKIDGRPWCFALMRGGLLAFNPRNGSIDFHYPWRASKLESVNASTPVVVGDKVFISECYQVGSSLLRVSPGKYEVLWKDEKYSRDKAMETHWNTAVFYDGFLFGSSGRHSGQAELRCIDLQTGKVAWSQARLGRSSLLLVDGHFICLSEDGTLRLIKASSEKYDLISEVVLERNGRQLLRYPAWAAPILANGLLFVRGEDHVVCLRVIPE